MIETPSTTIVAIWRGHSPFALRKPGTASPTIPARENCRSSRWAQVRSEVTNLDLQLVTRHLEWRLATQSESIYMYFTRMNHTLDYSSQTGVLRFCPPLTMTEVASMKSRYRNVMRATQVSCLLRPGKFCLPPVMVTLGAWPPLRKY